MARGSNTRHFNQTAGQIVIISLGRNNVHESENSIWGAEAKKKREEGKKWNKKEEVSATVSPGSVCNQADEQVALLGPNCGFFHQTGFEKELACTIFLSAWI